MARPRDSNIPGSHRTGASGLGVCSSCSSVGFGELSSSPKEGGVGILAYSQRSCLLPSSRLLYTLHGASPHSDKSGSHVHCVAGSATHSAGSIRIARAKYGRASSGAGVRHCACHGPGPGSRLCCASWWGGAGALHSLASLSAPARQPPALPSSAAEPRPQPAALSHISIRRLPSNGS